MGNRGFFEFISDGMWSKFLSTTEQWSFTKYHSIVRDRPELKQRSILSHVLKDQSFSPLYLTSLPTFSVFTETLRIYPILPFLERNCCSDYELPAPTGTGTVTLPAGTGVYVPVLGIHFDATYFQEPEKFDPERFTEENKHSLPNFSYIPFGEGPRMCIGKDKQIISPHKNFIFLLLKS